MGGVPLGKAAAKPDLDPQVADLIAERWPPLPRLAGL